MKDIEDIGASRTPHPNEARPLRGLRTLVYGLLAAFTLFSALASWQNFVHLRTVHLGHLADLAATGASVLLGERLRQLDTVGRRAEADFTGAATAFLAAHPDWQGVAVYGPHGTLDMSGAAPPRAVPAAPCASTTGCVVALETPAHANTRVWLVRKRGTHTIVGALPLAVLTPLWAQFPRHDTTDFFALRDPNGHSLRLWGDTVAPVISTWQAVGDTGLSLGVGISNASLRHQWWAIIWPGMLFLVLIASVAEAVMRVFKRSAAAVATEQARVRHTRNLYAALSDTNQLIVRHPDPKALFTKVCQVLVERAGVWVARIGWVVPSLTTPGTPLPTRFDPSIRWVAEASQAPNTTVDTALGPYCQPVTGATGTVITSGQMHQNPGPSECERLDFCQGEPTHRLLPIRQGTDIVAMLWLCTSEGILEDTSEQTLLDELVLDLGFSLEDTAQRRHLEYTASHDALTGLANHQHLLDRLQGEQDSTAPGVLAVFYLEGLREINTIHGREAGDVMLRATATRLQAAASAHTGALAARGDGDRLFLMLPGATPSEVEQRLAEVQAALDTPLRLSSSEDVGVQSTVGWAGWPEHWNGASGLMVRAELTLEAARVHGAGTIIGFTPALEETVHVAQRVRQDFDRALEHGELVLYYQPVLSLNNGRIEGVEALVRWRTEDGSVREPAAFLPQVEQDPRRLRNLGCFVLKEALTRIAAWSAAGLAVDVSVNIGASHLSDPAFVSDLEAALDEHDMCTRKRLLIEITESAYLAAHGAAVAALEAARARGVRAVLDDFGTAYASLSYLQDLPVHRIKIDYSFTHQLLQGRREEAIVSGMILTARLLGLDVVAEGVENDNQAELLHHLDCPKLQGYRIARPMPADQAETWLRAWDTTPWAWSNKGTMTPLFDRAEVFTLALQDWICARALAHTLDGTPAHPRDGCPWLYGATATPSPFGRWLAGPGYTLYGRTATFQALAAEHGELTAAARALTVRLMAGDHETLSEPAHALTQRYNGLLQRLRTLPLVPDDPA